MNKHQEPAAESPDGAEGHPINWEEQYFKQSMRLRVAVVMVVVAAIGHNEPIAPVVEFLLESTGMSEAEFLAHSECVTKMGERMVQGAIGMAA